MSELEILQQRFNDMSQQFPGLKHFLTVYSEDEKEPDIPPKYMPTKDNLIAIWGDGLKTLPIVKTNFSFV